MDGAYNNPVRVEVIGDGEVYDWYIARGKQKARAMLSTMLGSNGIKYMSHKLQLPNVSSEDYESQDEAELVNIYIYAKVRETAPHDLRILVIVGECTIHMDSGVADLINTAPKNEQRFDDAKLIVGKNLQGNTMWGEVTSEGDGYTVIPVGDTSPQAKEEKSPPAVTGQKIESFMYVAPERPDNMSDIEYEELCLSKKEILYSKKLTAQYLPAASFSGKIRLFVQSQFCRKLYSTTSPVADMEILQINPPQFTTSKFNSDGSVTTIYYPATGQDVRQYVNISNTAGGSTGIYTDDDNNYWFVNITPEGSTSRVNVTKIRLSICGNKVRRYINNTELSREEKAKFEALILSESVADGEMSFELPSVVNQAGASPIAYGWSFNWKGDEASIVVHDRTESVNFVGYMLKFSIGRDTQKTPTYAADASTEEKLAFEKSRWTCKVTKVEGGCSWRNKSGLFNIWVPAYDRGGVYEWGASTDFYNIQTQGASPIYCFYDKGDILKVLRYTGSETTGNSEIIGPPCFETYGDLSHCTIREGVTKTEVNTHGYTYNGAFSVGEVTFTGKVVTTTVLTKEWTLINNGPTGNYANAARQTSPITFYTAPVCVSTDIVQYVAALNTMNPPYTLLSYTVMYEQGPGSLTTINGVESTTNLVSVVIPWYDCCAVYLGESKNKRIIGTQSYQPPLGTYKFKEYSRVSHFADGVLIIDAYGPSYTWEMADQSAFLGASENSKIDESTTTESFSIIGYDMNEKTKKGGWNPNLFSPSLLNLWDQQPFSTLSSAVFGDTMVPSMEIDSGEYGVETMNYKAFIGFA